MTITLVVTIPLVLESGILASVVAIFADGSHWGGTVFIPKPDSAEALIGPGILGAFVGTVLWFIGRPDRAIFQALIACDGRASRGTCRPSRGAYPQSPLLVEDVAHVG
jgi:hypothetical protein